MSVPRLLNIITLLLFIVFVATFFTVLVRLSRVGLVTERYGELRRWGTQSEEIIRTDFQLLGQDPVSGQLRFRVSANFDTESRLFNNVEEGEPITLRITNMIPELQRNYDSTVEFRNVTGDRWVRFDFGEILVDVFDRRDFYPFDWYEMSFDFAFHVYDKWHAPKMLYMRSMTNLIFLDPRYMMTELGRQGFRLSVARLRIQQFLAVTFILIEVLFLLYLLTIVNLHELMTKALGYVIGLFIIREILVTNAPMFPTIVDYGTMFLIIVVFFLMLFRFLGGAEERALITIPPAWLEAFKAGTDGGDDEKTAPVAGEDGTSETQ